MLYPTKMTSFALALLCIQVVAQDILPGTRDPWSWPFDRNSIWNMPIGSNAQYKDAGFEAARSVGNDIQHILKLNESDPLRRAYQTTTFGPGRCDGTEPHDFWLNIPDNWLVPDAGSSPYGVVRPTAISPFFCRPLTPFLKGVWFRAA